MAGPSGQEEIRREEIQGVGPAFVLLLDAGAVCQHLVIIHMDLLSVEFIFHEKDIQQIQDQQQQDQQDKGIFPFAPAALYGEICLPCQGLILIDSDRHMVIAAVDQERRQGQDRGPGRHQIDGPVLLDPDPAVRRHFPYPFWS